MYLVQFLLPVRDDAGAPFPAEAFGRVREELTERFGGATAYLRAPAAGSWKDEGGGVERDEVVMVEVVTEALDRAWWASYRGSLERRFGQERVLVRATRCEVL